MEIFKDVALLLDDAEIDEVFKDTVTGVSDNKKSSSRCTPHRDEVRVWMLPANSKFFNLDDCLEKCGYVYWAQYYHLQKGSPRTVLFGVAELGFEPRYLRYERSVEPLQRILRYYKIHLKNFFRLRTKIFF